MSKESFRMNRERYSDKTANTAIGNITKEEKIKAEVAQMCERYGYKIKVIKLEKIERG